MVQDVINAVLHLLFGNIISCTVLVECYPR